VDRNTKNDYLFSLENSLSLVSLAKDIILFNSFDCKVANYGVQFKQFYISPEMHYILTKNNQTANFTEILVGGGFRTVLNAIGEDSVFINDLDEEENLIEEFIEFDFTDFEQITRLVIFEIEVLDTLSGARRFVLEKIAFAKKYPELSSKYFITFSVNFDCFVEQNNALIEVELPTKLSNELTDLSNPKSAYSFLRQLQLGNRDIESNKRSYSLQFGDYFTKTPPEIHQNSSYTLQKRLSGLYNTLGEDSLYLNPQTNELVPYYEEVTDTVITWVNIPNPKVFLNYKVSDTNVQGNLVLESVRFQYALNDTTTYSIHLTSSSLDAFFEGTNFNRYTNVFNHTHVSQIPSIQFLQDRAKKPAKNYILNTAKGRKKIENDFFVNPYFIKADPNFGVFFNTKE
jgi:hypothetical protein